MQSLPGSTGAPDATLFESDPNGISFGVSRARAADEPFTVPGNSIAECALTPAIWVCDQHHPATRAARPTLQPGGLAGQRSEGSDMTVTAPLDVLPLAGKWEQVPS